MHETHWIEPIVRGIDEHARREGAKRVSQVTLKIGEMLGITEASFTETFVMLSKGTLLEGTRLKLSPLPGASRIEVVSFVID